MRVSSNQGSLHNTQTHCVGLSLLHFCRLRFFFLLLLPLLSPSSCSLARVISLRPSSVSQSISVSPSGPPVVSKSTPLLSWIHHCLSAWISQHALRLSLIILLFSYIHVGVCEAIVAHVSLVFVLCPSRVCVSAVMLREGITRVQPRT